MITKEEFEKLPSFLQEIIAKEAQREMKKYHSFSETLKRKIKNFIKKI